ncbi:hypothetical protein LEN26_007075 [Aphanomyces euteiches]|nr:hypothetical protein LEN26_007075 [Aphanomyces euteiches]
MIQHALALMLQRLLGKFLTLDASQLNLSIWSGDLTFKNLQLKLGYGRGEVGELQIQVPWRALWTQPVVLRAQHIRIHAHAQSENTDVKVDNVVQAVSEEQDRTYLTKLLACIIGNIQIELEDIQIQYECAEDSREKASGYGVCTIERIALQNTDGDWSPAFIDPAEGGNVSRKRLRIQGLSAYVTPYVSTTRHYAFHNWSSDIKATLFYQSSSAAIPDVSLDISFDVDECFQVDCNVCKAVIQPQDTSPKLQFHFDAIHVDVLSAILAELKAPFDHYDQLTQLGPNKTAGFALVLTYAKQWLLADCIDAGSKETVSLCDEDDDEIFEDAVAPPSLSINLHTDSEIEASKISKDEVKVVGRYRSHSLEMIQSSVDKIPEYNISSLFGSEDAAFHDAAEESVAETLLPWLSFELIGLSGWTIDPTTNAIDSRNPLFQQVMATCTIDFKTEQDEESNSSYLVQDVKVRINEWNIGFKEYQYETIIGMIYENFKEVNSIVNENFWPRCQNCGGFHGDTIICNVDWLRVSIDVEDALLSLRKAMTPPEKHTNIDFEQLKIMITMKTSDDLNIDVSAVAFSISEMNDVIKEYVRPTQAIRDVPQLYFTSTSSYTDSKYIVHFNHSHVILIPDSLTMLTSFFSWPFWMKPVEEQLVFLIPPSIDWKIMEVCVVFDKACCFYLLEEFNKVDTRALVLMAKVKFDYTWSQDVTSNTSSTKVDCIIEQHGLYFSSLPDLRIDIDFPLMNAFTFQYMHLMEYLHKPSLQASQRYAVSLHADKQGLNFIPVEARVSVQDALLLSNIGNIYKAHKNMVFCGRELTAQSETPKIISDRLLADIGGLRVVLVNNSLGVPIVDIVMSEIECEYECTKDTSMSIGGIFHCNYFNNSIYRWEPLIEPFEIQSASLLSNSLDVELNLPFALNVNITPAMAPILFMENLLQADDVVASGVTVITPFWLQNSLGTSIKFSFAHGESFIQDSVDHSQVVPIDCRDKNTHLRTFDKASELDTLLSQRNNLTAQHSLFIWVTGSQWMSLNPVTVDVVGHIAIGLRPVEEYADEEDLSFPVIVAEISLQEDGSKLIHLHSQVLVRNETSMPLILWGYAPPGIVEEWIVDRETTSYVPLHLIHPEARLSVRPSLETDYAPLASTFGEFEKEIRSAQLNFDHQRRRFVRSGACTCKSKGNGPTSQILSMQLLPGMLVRELPAWHCVYDVEAFALINSSLKANGPVARSTSTVVPEDEEDERESDLFEALLRLDEKSSPISKQQVIVDISEEAKLAKQDQESSTLHFAHILTLKPYLTLHNRLACPVAYRILAQSLQLVAEGVLTVGEMLPLFQISSQEELFVSFRLENYNWSELTTLLHPKTSCIPFKESNDNIKIRGRSFPQAAKVHNSQGPVPDLLLRLKKKDRDVIVYSSLWIVNHTGLPLEYCDALSRKSMENAFTYMHNRPGSLASTNFVRRLSTVMDPPSSALDAFQLFEKPATIVPVAIYLVVKEAQNLPNRHKYVGTQNPYVRASLFVPKQTKNGEIVESLFCFATTKPHVSGGINPKFSRALGNTMYLPFPTEMGVYQLQSARVVVEMRSTWYGSDTLLGIVSLPLSEISSKREKYAGFEWHELIKRKSSKHGPVEGESGGKILMSFTLATKHFIDAQDSGQSWGIVQTTPRKITPQRTSLLTETPFELTVYLPTNRFTSVVISVVPSTTVLEIIIELLLPRFVSLRSAGRPEAERWYGAVLSDGDIPIKLIGKKFGVHLCHRITFNTLRLYDESSTASVHHSTPRSLAKQYQPNQVIPVEWSEAINFGSKSGSSWDVLRVRTSKSSWSDAVRIHRNALGNSGVAQLLTLVEEAQYARFSLRKQFELALWSCYGPGVFGDTIVTTIVPRYVLINQTSFPLSYRQHNCQLVTTLLVNDMKPFHWDNADEPKKSIEVTFADGEMDWSGPFMIHSLGELIEQLF